jgi:WD40 repeat protein/serine/threonine protein kinase
MSSEADTVLLWDERLNAAVLDYMKLAEAGQAPTGKELEARYGDLADELQRFIDNDKLIGLPLEPLLLGLQVAAPPPEVKPFGHYEQFTELGRGGQAIVYKALDTKLKRFVALKLVRNGQYASVGEVQRFRREAEIAAGLDHAHIVTVYESGEHEGLPYVSMRLIEGGTLRTNAGFRLPDLRPMSGKDPTGVTWSKAQLAARARRLAHLLATIAEAVHYAHQRGLIHRDLKPANILLDGQDEPHVTDFGLAKHLAASDNPDSAHAIAGTAPYMAPEQVRGEKTLTVAVDVYGLGAILYELLTGQPPFYGNDAAIFEQVLNQEPVPPSRLRPHVPRDLEVICLKCLHKEPGKRYADALKVAEDLRRYLAGQPIKGRRASTWERACKWARRKPAIALLTAAIVLVSIAGLASVIWQWRKTVAANEELRYQNYDNSITVSWQRLVTGYPHRAEEILERCPAELRGWEWHYLKRWWQYQAFDLDGHAAAVQALELSADGKLLASGGRDGTVRLWDPWTRQEVGVLHHDTDAVECVAFSGDGKVLASAGADWTVKVWDVSRRTELHTFPGAGKVMALSPDGKLLAVAGNGPVQVWNVATGKALGHLNLQHGAKVECLAFSLTGAWLVSGGGGTSRAKLWRVATGKEVRLLGPSTGGLDQVTAASFSGDGRHLALATGNTARIWDLQEAALPRRGGKELEKKGPQGFTGRTCSVAYGTDGQHLAISFRTGIVAVWDMQDGKPVYTGAIKGIPKLTFHSGDQWQCLAFPTGKTVRVERWKRTAREDCFSLPSSQAPLASVVFSADGTRVAAAAEDGTITVGDITRWEAGIAKVSDRFPAHNKGATSVAFLPDGRLASAGRDKTAKIWDLATRQFVLLPGHLEDVTCVACSGDGRYVATGSSDKTVRVWDAATGKLCRSLLADSGGYVSHLAFSPDSRQLASACDHLTVKVWDVESGKVVLKLEHPGTVQAVAFSTDGRIASGSEDSTVRVWDARTGKLLHLLRGHVGAIPSVAFSPDGKRLVSASIDKTVKLWDLATGQEILTLPGSAAVTSVAFSPNGHLLATADHKGTVKIRIGAPVQ